MISVEQISLIFQTLYGTFYQKHIDFVLGLAWHATVEGMQVVEKVGPFEAIKQLNFPIKQLKFTIFLTND